MAHQFGAGGLPLLVAELDGLTPCQRQKVCRQTVRAWHLGTFHKHRHDAYAARERGNSFEVHEVGGIIEAPTAAAVNGEPVLTDKHDQDLA